MKKRKSKPSLPYLLRCALRSRTAYGTKKADSKPDQIRSYGTMKRYLSAAEGFGRWCQKTHGCRDLESALAHVQEYLDHRTESGLTADTVNTDASALAKVFGVPKNTWRYPGRADSPITKGRGAVPAGAGSTASELNALIGVRRDELESLRVRDLVERPEGFCAHVLQGKGGKEQYQLILPQHQEALRAFAAKKPAEAYLLPREATGGKENLHAMRRQVAREGYAYFLGQPKEEVRQMIADRMREFGRDPMKNRDFKLLDTPYRTRPNGRGQPVSYDRTALLATSVFMLSHWRCDVTVKHYMK